MKPWGVLIPLTLAWSCTSSAMIFHWDGRTWTAEDAKTLRSRIQAYDPAQEPTAALDFYRAYYHLDFPETTYRAGTLEWRPGDKVFVQTFWRKPQAPVVLLLHGYLEHTALNRRAVAFFLDKGFNVTALDLPGHGLSTGKRGYIKTFDDYGDVVAAVVKLLDLPLKKASGLWACGHSTGAAALMNWVSRYPHDLQGLIFLAPLIRPYLWTAAQVGLILFGWTTETVPNSLGNSATSNPQFEKLLNEGDPYRIASTNLNWVRAMDRWQTRLIGMTPPLYQGPVLVCQGTRDTVVDGPFNLKLLKSLCPQMESHVFSELKHTLYNEPGPQGDGIYRTIAAFLKAHGAP